MGHLTDGIGAANHAELALHPFEDAVLWNAANPRPPERTLKLSVLGDVEMHEGRAVGARGSRNGTMARYAN
jgi:hypothetical protein